MAFGRKKSSARFFFLFFLLNFSFFAKVECQIDSIFSSPGSGTERESDASHTRLNSSQRSENFVLDFLCPDFMCKIPGWLGGFATKRFCRIDGENRCGIGPTKCPADLGETPITNLPTGATVSNPVQIFLQAGQSECVGSASVDKLRADSASYPNLVGTQTGKSWFAGSYQPTCPGAEDRFFMAPMEPGAARPNMFGPEIAIGDRLHEITGAPILVVKYCWGGSNVEKEWNPNTAENSWDSNQDDGTAQWLRNNAGVDLTSKKALFVNLIYTTRLATEALDQANIPYLYKGLFWIQGEADRDRSWQDYGTDLANLWDATRRILNQPTLPIVDTGGVGSHGLRSGKAHAGQLVDQCNAFTVVPALLSHDPDSDCVNTPSSPCDDNFVNYDVFEFYGYDTQFPDEMKPTGATNQVFHWYKNWGSNHHSEYEGMILKGRMLAHAYIQQFTSFTLPQNYIDNDYELRFPWPTCQSTGGSKPSASNICWIDERIGVQINRCS